MCLLFLKFLLHHWTVKIFLFGFDKYRCKLFVQKKLISSYCYLILIKIVCDVITGKMFTEGEEGVEYDEDGNEIPSSTSKKNIDPLPVVYHSQIDYKPFNKNFYNEHDEINNMNLLQIIDLRHKLNIKVQGTKCPKPVSSFAHFGFPEKLISSIRLDKYYFCWKFLWYFSKKDNDCWNVQAFILHKLTWGLISKN